MPKTKILFIPYTISNGGGAEFVLSLLINNLNQEKYEIGVFEIQKYDKILALNKNIKVVGSLFDFKQGIFHKLRRMIKRFCLYHFPFVLKQMYKLNGYDAVITFNYLLPSFMLPAFRKEKKIGWFHGDIYDLLDTAKKSEKQKQHHVWKDADAIVTISNKSLRSLQNVFPDLYGKARIIYNGIDVENVIRLGSEQCSFNFDIPTLICSGRLEENKNVALVIKALSVLLKRNIKCQLVITGRGEQENYLKELADNLNVSDSVSFMGFVSNQYQYQYLARSRILCICSFSEGWGMTAVEAMSLGIPFVTTPVAGASEELSDGGKCGLVSDYDSEHYADALQKLLTDTDLYKEMSKNCKEKAKEYSVEKYVAAFEKLLSDVGAGK